MEYEYILNKQRFGISVKENRLKMKLTQEKLANILDMPVNMISDIERGVRLPGRDKMFNLAGYLNVSIDNCIRSNSRLFNDYDEILKLTHKQQKYVLDVMKYMITSLMK
jgi:Predicted transcriptional regulators